MDSTKETSKIAAWSPYINIVVGKCADATGRDPPADATRREGRAPARPCDGGGRTRGSAALPQMLRGDEAGGPRSCVAVRRGRADARERVPPADATRRQGGRATLPRGRATGEGGRAGARPSRIGEGAGTSGASGRTSSARRPGVRASYPWGGFYEGDVLRGDGHLTAENVVKVRLYNGAERLMARHARAGREEDVVHVDDAHRLVRLPNLFGCEKRPTFPAARKLHAA